MSLPAKLVVLKIGEVIILPDPNVNMDRAMQTITRRSPKLVGMTFVTSRTRYIEGDRLMPAVKIERVA